MKLSEIRSVVTTEGMTIQEAALTVNRIQDSLGHQLVTEKQLSEMCLAYSEHWGDVKFKKVVAPRVYKPDIVYQQRLVAFLEDYGPTIKLKKFDIDKPWVRDGTGMVVNANEYLLDQISRGIVQLKIYTKKLDLNQTLRQFLLDKKMTMTKWAKEVGVEVKKVRRLADCKLRELPKTLKDVVV